jgi:hypothetical protein
LPSTFGDTNGRIRLNLPIGRFESPNDSASDVAVKWITTVVFLG